MSSMASLPIDTQSTQSCSGVPLSQWGLQNAGNKGGSPPDKVGQLHHGVQSNTIDCRVLGLLRGDRSSKGGQGTMRLLRCNCRDTVSSKVNVRDGQVWLAYRVTFSNQSSCRVHLSQSGMSDQWNIWAQWQPRYRSSSVLGLRKPRYRAACSWGESPWAGSIGTGRCTFCYRLPGRTRMQAIDC